MSRVRPFLALAAALAAAVLAIAGYRVLHPSERHDAAVREAIAQFGDPKQEVGVERLLASAAQTGPARLRAQAANLLASLLIRHGARELADAEQLYAAAVRLDPTDDASKFDLELLFARQGRRGNHHAREQRAPKTTATTRLRSQPGGAGAAAKRSRYGY